MEGLTGITPGTICAVCCGNPDLSSDLELGFFDELKIRSGLLKVCPGDLTECLGELSLSFGLKLGLFTEEPAGLL